MSPQKDGLSKAKPMDYRAGFQGSRCKKEVFCRAAGAEGFGMTETAEPPGFPALSPPADPIDPVALKRALAGSLFEPHLHYYDSLESTNSLAKTLAVDGGPEGTVLIANEQTAGRGRRGRAWLSPGGSSLLFSLLLRPAIDPEQVFSLTMILAVSTAIFLESKTSLLPRVKWPNDLYLNGRKLAGILTELGMEGKRVSYVVLGMGLNVHWQPSPGAGLRGPATSLLLETGESHSRADLLCGILREFEDGYRRFLSGDRESFCRRWNELSMVLGRNVVVESESGAIRGKALGIDPNGALILDEDGGSRRRILCGDVSLRMGKEA
jgi:BirA family transcriptional regulator, biotin operon repressor / biotin---[acetyl-CoA-carboxylase] ligase